MTEWVLIIWACFSGCGTATVEGFTTETACERALQEVQQTAKESEHPPRISGACVKVS